jgi:hypothetical protein
VGLRFRDRSGLRLALHRLDSRQKYLPNANRDRGVDELANHPMANNIGKFDCQAEAGAKPQSGAQRFLRPSDSAFFVLRRLGGEPPRSCAEARVFRYGIAGCCRAAASSPENSRIPRLERHSRTLTNCTARIAAVEFRLRWIVLAVSCRCSPRAVRDAVRVLSKTTQLSKKALISHRDYPQGSGRHRAALG